MSELSRLPTTTQDAWEWQYSGLCSAVDPRLFFHPESERGPARRNRDNAAVAVCIQCPVIADCRNHALSVREGHGVWGGLTEQDRRTILQLATAP